MSNANRVNRATVAVHAYYATDPTGDDRRSTLVDLLTDLRHYADTHGIDFESVAVSSYNHHQEEK